MPDHSASNTPQGFGSQSPSTLAPIGALSSPGGYAAPASIQSQDSKGISAGLASKVLRDPLMLRMLCDRIYELMLEDLRNQHERSRNYGGRYG